MKFAYWILAFKSALATAACCAALATQADTGIVVDDTGKPIPDAVVLAAWNGVIRTFVEPHSTCYKVEVSRTDQSGKFSISSFSGNFDPFLMDRTRSIIALAPGYRLSPKTDIEDPRIVLERQSGTSSERIKAIRGTGMVGCNGAKNVVIPYLKALYAEVNAIATTKEDRLEAADILFHIESIELGQDEALVRDGQRVQHIKEGS